jgi:hypothetical protein
MKTMVAFSLICLLTCAILEPAAAQTYQYAVKIVCGKPSGGDVAPGKYFTAINVHNPQEVSLPFRWKVARSDMNVAPSRFTTQTVGPDSVFEFTCATVARYGGLTSTAYFTGFVVIESSRELDVVAVYTAAGSTASVEAIHTERVPARRIK